MFNFVLVGRQVCVCVWTERRDEEKVKIKGF